jgi:hypothetical protein
MVIDSDAQLVATIAMREVNRDHKIPHYRAGESLSEERSQETEARLVGPDSQCPYRIPSKENQMKKKKILLVPVLLLSLMVACLTPTWVTTAENIAKAIVPIAGAVIGIVLPGSAPLVAAVQVAFNALIKTLDDYQASPTATNLQSLQAALNAVNKNVADLETAGQVKDPATRDKYTKIIGLLTQAVAEIAALVPPSATKTALRLPSGVRAKGLKAADFTREYNAIAAGDSNLPQLK